MTSAQGPWRAEERASFVGFVVCRELPCVNGLSARFDLVEIPRAEDEAIAMTDGAADDEGDLARRVALGLNLVEALGEREASDLLAARCGGRKPRNEG